MTRDEKADAASVARSGQGAAALVGRSRELGLMLFSLASDITSLSLQPGRWSVIRQMTTVGPVIGHGQMWMRGAPR